MPLINLTFARRYTVTFLVLLATAFTAYSQKKEARSPLNKILNFSTADSVKRYSDSLLAVARTANDKVLQCKILNKASFKYYQLGQENVALDYARRALALITPQQDSAGYVRAKLMVAYMLSRGAKNEEAFKEAFSTLKITDKFGWRKLRIETKICIADIYRPVREVDRAIPFAQEAVNESKALKDTGLYVYAMSTLSNVLSGPRKQGDIPVENAARAAVLYEIILAKPYQQHLSAFQKANFMGNLGRLYEMQHKYDKAEKVLAASIDTANKYNYPSLAKHSLNELSTLSLDHHNFKKAIEYGLKALAVQQDGDGNRTLQRNIYNKLAEAYEGIGDYKNAYNYAVKENKLNDSILTTDQSRYTAELDKKYQNDKRLLLADNKNNLLKQQRNFTVIAAIVCLLILVVIYRWFIDKKKKEAAALAREHQQLARLDAMKTRFFANVSHELKTPLTLIMGPADQIYRSNIVPETEKQSAKAILRNSTKLLDMINELLDLGKIETGNLQIKAQPVHLASFIKLLFQGFASAAEYKQISYTLTNTISEHLHAAIDRDKFEKIANNFLSNAVKFTPGGRSVNVHASIENGMIVFSVEDNGSGIHPEDVAQIFERYYQGRQNRLNAEGGTGIGLSIAKEFAEAMGGRIELDNTYGQGALFTAYIPFVEVFVQDSGTSLRDEEETDDVTPPLTATVTGKRKILVVEDHEEMVRFIASILSPLYDVQTANNGVKAMEILNNSSTLPDLIVSDVMMPEMDGFTLLNKLKAHPGFCSIPVIMLTALADSRNKLKALNIGVDDYLTKPFVSSELFARVNNLLANADSRNGEDEAEPKEVDGDQMVALSAKPFTVKPSPADLAWLTELETVVRKHVGKTDLNLAILADELAISERQLFRRIKSITGLTPNKYIRVIRLQIAREAIESGKCRTIAEISYLAGFDTPAYFSKLFKEQFDRDVSELL